MTLTLLKHENYFQLEWHALQAQVSKMNHQDLLRGLREILSENLKVTVCHCVDNTELDRSMI